MITAIIFNCSINAIPYPWQTSFQKPATTMMEGIIDLHHDIFTFLIIIIIFVSCLLVAIFVRFFEQTPWMINLRRFPLMRFRSGHGTTYNTTLEIVWTIIPTVILLLIATPSFALIYALDEVFDPQVTVRIIGRQWYWTYEYPDSVTVEALVDFDDASLFAIDAPIMCRSVESEIRELLWLNDFDLIAEEYGRFELPDFLEAFFREWGFISCWLLDLYDIIDVYLYDEISQCIINGWAEWADLQLVEEELTRHLTFLDWVGIDTDELGIDDFYMFLFDLEGHDDNDFDYIQYVHDLFPVPPQVLQLPDGFIYLNLLFGLVDWEDVDVDLVDSIFEVLLSEDELFLASFFAAFFPDGATSFEIDFLRDFYMFLFDLEGHDDNDFDYIQYVHDLFLALSLRHFDCFTGNILLDVIDEWFKNVESSLINYDEVDNESFEDFFLLNYFLWALETVGGGESECYVIFSLPGFALNSYIVPTEDLFPGSFRLLEVNRRMALPFNVNIRLLMTSYDVIHSWSVPAFGLKVDCLPGRLNEYFLNVNYCGLFYGQCSEICGVNHGFMPIKVDVMTDDHFRWWFASTSLGENPAIKFRDLGVVPPERQDFVVLSTVWQDRGP